MRTLKMLGAALCVLIFAACSNAQNKTTKSTTMNEQTKNNPHYSRTDTTKLNVTDAEWKKILSPEVYRIARLAGTEYAFSGKYYKTDIKGTYYCVVCGNPLFRSGAKFASSCGWPSFYETMRPNSVIYLEDHSHGMDRVEVRCGRCESHLGHIFDDGPAPTFKRFCMNSAVLDFEPDAGAEK